MGIAESISFEEVRARKQWTIIRQQLHERFEQWLDALEERLSASQPTLPEVTQVVWDLRQSLMGRTSTIGASASTSRGGVAQTLVCAPMKAAT
jgi:hypothetical protein